MITDRFEGNSGLFSFEPVRGGRWLRCRAGGGGRFWRLRRRDHDARGGGRLERAAFRGATASRAAVVASGTFGTRREAAFAAAHPRQQPGVRRYRVLRPTDDPNYIMVDLDFDSASEAESFLATLWRNVWSSREAAPALVGESQTRIVEAVEVKEY